MKQTKAFKIGELIAKVITTLLFIGGVLLVMHFDQVAINMGMLH